ncbi:hypothetical protein BDV18DRAFT_161934 [Aspergillus unguis]
MKFITSACFLIAALSPAVLGQDVIDGNVALTPESGSVEEYNVTVSPTDTVCTNRPEGVVVITNISIQSELPDPELENFVCDFFSEENCAGHSYSVTAARPIHFTREFKVGSWSCKYTGSAGEDN